MLPTGYTYKIREYTPLHKENSLKTSKDWFGAKFQFYCKTVNEAKKWKDSFEEMNKLSFRVRSVHHPKGSKVHTRVILIRIMKISSLNHSLIHSL